MKHQIVPKRGNSDKNIDPQKTPQTSSFKVKDGKFNYWITLSSERFNHHVKHALAAVLCEVPVHVVL